MSSARLLDVVGLRSGYGHAEVLRGVGMHVDNGELVALIGSNGAGKSTLLKSIVGLVQPMGGTVVFDASDITGSRPERLVRAGISLVPEGRLLFGSLTVRENLELGAYTKGRGRAVAIPYGLKRVHALFPVLEERSTQRAETLSGGEQQMLAVGRALMSDPRLLLLDEPSLGLAPRVIAEIFSALDALRGEGMTILLVEQDARLALKHGDRGYVMRNGRIALEGTASELLADENVRTIYLGSWSEGRSGVGESEGKAR